MERKTKFKLTDFECNLLINGMNEFRNMLLSENLPTEDIDDLTPFVYQKFLFCLSVAKAMFAAE